jgi:SOS-response transcriptional repressor LexA
MATPATVLTMRQAEYLLLEAHLPGAESPATARETIGVLLHAPDEDRLEVRLRRDWNRIAADDEAEVLEALAHDIESRIAELGAASFLAWIGETLSNTIRVSERVSVTIGSFDGALARLYRQHVPSTVQPYRTHLPVYTLRAAAGRWGEQMEEAVEPGEWIEAPENLRLTGGMFIAQVVGRSMEPVIPDGSWCVFRAPVVGSRENKRVLVVNRDESEEGGQRYTVKRYRSHKVRREDGGWEHGWIRFEPLNPDYPAWEVAPGERVEVLAEFIDVLE